MTLHAAAVVEGGWLSARRFVRIVAREACECALALSRARALVQVDRLVPHIPGIVPVDDIAFRGGRPMTLAAELVQLSS